MERRIILFFLLALLSKLSFAQPCPGAIASFPFNETFEASNGNWVPGGAAPDWAWGTPTKPVINAAGEGTKCWITGGLTNSSYNNGENSWLQSPCFDFTTLVHPRISFKIFWETEKKFDGASFQYSTDGTVWNTVGSISSNTNCQGVNWYNTPSITYLGGSAGWTGNIQAGSCGPGGGSGAWLTASHDLTNLAGQAKVQFRFTFGAGTICNSYDGFAFDDVKIFESPPNTADFDYVCKPNLTVDFSSLSVCTSSTLWDFGDAASIPNNSSTNQLTTHVFSAPGTYTVTLNSTFSSGPPASVQKQITILDVTANIDRGVSCNGAQDAILHATGAGSTTGYTYVWNTSPVQTGPIINVGAGNYTVTVTPNSGLACAATANFVITEPTALLLAPGITAQKCSANNGAIISNLSGGTPPYTYLWTNSATTPDISNLSAGDYSLHATDIDGCPIDSGPLTVVHDNGSIVVDLGGNKAVCPGQTVVLNPGNYSSYLWQDNSTSSTYNVTQTGNYSVTVTDANGCSGTGSVHVEVDCTEIYFPTAFTPNGDTKNELFGPAGNNFTGIYDYHMEVYNRYGELVFLSTDPAKKWDGKVRGKISGNESFVWTASFYQKGVKEFRKGVVTLIK